jgi:ABC-type dipeptide/oligopeptide/nickel transport system permease component
MWRYLVGRSVQTLLSMLVVISIVFFLTRLSGNPVHLLLDVNASERDQQILMHHLGLDKSLAVQYGLYVRNIFLGDFGRSVLTRRPGAGCSTAPRACSRCSDSRCRRSGSA